MLVPTILVYNYCNEAKALFARASVKPGQGRKKKIDRFIKQCKRDGNWVLSDCLWFFAAHDQSFSPLNWIKNDHNITEVNSPIWTLDRGYAGNAVNMYLNTNYNPSTQGVNWTLNNAALGIYVRNNVIEGASYGYNNASAYGTIIAPRHTTVDFAGRINAQTINTQAAPAINDSRGLSVVLRTNNTTQLLYRNGLQVGSSAISSDSVISVNVFLLARNNNGVPANHGTHQHAFAFCGAGTINQLTLFNAVEEYLDAIGAGVV